MRSGLRYKFIGIVLLAAIPFLFYSLYHYLSTVRENRKTAIEQNFAKAEEISHNIEEFIDNSQSVLYSLALHPAIIDLRSSECDAIFSQLLPLYPYHLNILATDMQGRSFASAVKPQTANPLDYQDKEWFIRGSKGVSVVTDVHQSKLFSQPAFMITMPVFDSSGEQRAVIGFPVDLYALQKHYAETRNLGAHTVLTVVDKRGIILLSTADRLATGKPCKQEAVLRKMAEDKSGSLSAPDNDGGQSYYSFATVEATGWKVLVGVKASEVYAEANSAAFRHLLFFVSICLTGTLAALWYSGQLRTRIEELIGGLNRAAAGDLGVRLAIAGKDELTVAGDAFNLMVSEREKAEEEIRESAATLEKRVELRTEELTNAKNELEAFSYAVSHDLQAPVRHILAYTQILLDEHGGECPETLQEYLQRINRSGLQMRELITHLLDLSRLNQHNLDRRQTDLGSLCRALCTDLAEAEPQRQVEVVIGEGLQADADPALLAIALQNLLGNAWKYTRVVAKPRIEVGETFVRGLKCFFVRDNGSGFNMEYADKLFVPFQRLHSQAEFEGSGVGLATVMRIVQRHGGTIWAESSPGNGATFYFTFGNREEYLS